MTKILSNYSNAVISVKNTNNTAVGFVRENIQIIHTIAGKGNSRSEVFEGKGRGDGLPCVFTFTETGKRQIFLGPRRQPDLLVSARIRSITAVLRAALRWKTPNIIPLELDLC